MSASDMRRVTNQAPALAGHNVVTGDAALSAAVLRHAGKEALDSLVFLVSTRGGRHAPGGDMAPDVRTWPQPLTDPAVSPRTK